MASRAKAGPSSTMASSSATPLAAEMAPEDLSAREAEATVKFDEGLALIKAGALS